MSDPVTNSEIEDVLSSIRRLVSDDAKKPSGQASLAEKLVLTASQRVEAPSETGAELTAEQDVPEAANDELEEPVESDVDRVLSNLVALVDEEIDRAVETAFDPAGAEHAPSVDADAEDQTALAAEPAQELQDQALSASESEAEDASTNSALEQKIAALEKLVAQNVDDWDTETDDLSPPLFQHNPARALDWKADIASVPNAAPKAEGSEASAPSAGVEGAEMEEPSDEPLSTMLEDIIQADRPGSDVEESPSDDIGSVVEDLSNQAEPALDDPLPHRGAAETVEDLQAAPVDPEPKAAAPSEQQETVETQRDAKVTPFVLRPQDPPSVAEVSEPDPVVEEDTLGADVPDLLSENALSLDEEALRDLVGDLVRRELQGALGERITRNVRKLVRREIHRVMVSRDFD